MICTSCRNVSARSDEEGRCAACGTELISAPYRWSPPKKTNSRAWKRIAKGELLWDRRRVRRAKRRNTTGKYEYKAIIKSGKCVGVKRVKRVLPDPGQFGG